MAELVAEQAYSGPKGDTVAVPRGRADDGVVVVQLGTIGKVHDSLSLEGISAGGRPGRKGSLAGCYSAGHSPAGRPDVVVDVAVTLAVTGIDDVHDVEVAVIVGVIKREIDAGHLAGDGTGFEDHVGSFGVGASSVAEVTTVVTQAVGQLNRSDNVEGGRVLAERLVLEVAFGRAVGLVVLVIVAVQHRIHVCDGVDVAEMYIQEVDEDDESSRRQISDSGRACGFIIHRAPELCDNGVYFHGIAEHGVRWCCKTPAGTETRYEYVQYFLHFLACFFAALAC